MANRRAWGEGSMYFSQSKNVWVWEGNYTINGVKKRKSFTARSRKELKDKFEKFKENYSKEILLLDKITLKEWIEKWLELFVKPTVKIKTYDNYKQRLQYAVESLGAIKLRDLTAIVLQEFFNDLLVNGGQNNQGLAPDSVRRIRTYLKITLDSAIKNNLMTENPIEGTKAPKKTKKKPVVLNEEQTTRFLEIVKSGRYIYHGIKNPKFLNRNEGTEYYIKSFYNLINLALASGMRIGELRGLSWFNVDFEKNVVSVKTQIIDTVDEDCIFDDPKPEKSVRSISIDSSTMKELLAFRDYQKQYADNLGDQYDNKHFLCFTNTFGKAFSVSNFRKRYFSKMVAAAEISEDYTIHCMRHTHATLLLKNGVSPKVVSERLGHSSVIVTLNIYAHVLEEMEQEAPSIWENIVHKGI